MLPLLKRHPLPVQVFFHHGLVLTYALPREVLQPLLPPGLTLDTFEGYGFIAMFGGNLLTRYRYRYRKANIVFETSPHAWQVLIFVVGMMGLLCLLWTRALLEPAPLAKVLLGGITLFWAARSIAQFWIHDSTLWRGHAFNTRVHIVFSSLWLYLVSVFTAAWLSQLRH